MAFALATAHNIISSCCGPEGNIFNKLFKKDDNEDQGDSAPTPSAATAAPATAAAATATAPSMATNIIKEFTDKDAKFEDVPWSKLPISARKAAKAIGFDQTTWDNKEWLPVDSKHWDELTPEELAACETLGWSKDSWDTKYDGVYWKDLPDVVKRACEKMGWDQTKWDEDWDVDCWEKDWEEFSDDEKRALHVLGYYVHTW